MSKIDFVASLGHIIGKVIVKRVNLFFLRQFYVFN